MKYIKFYRYLIPFWKIEIAILSLSCLTMALSLVNPYLTKLVIDKAYGNRDMGLFIKYGAFIGETGCKISEGQKQRIAIARALIKRPRILILDEAMSAIDSETENRIIDNIKKEFKNSTLIAISHRLATVEKMDRVYFLTGPSFIELASHEELMNHNFKYNELFASRVPETIGALRK